MSRGKRQIVVIALFALVLLFLLSSFRVAVVHGDSMLPTYRDGQMVLVNRLMSPGGLRRGDVVLVKRGNDVLIKRVYRLAGETIPRKDARAFAGVNELLEPTRDARYPLKVPAGMLVVLGDNPAVSDDSRMFGPVATSDIIGRVLFTQPRP